MITLAIDFGSKNIGIALLQNEKGENAILFAGTVRFDRTFLRKKISDRVELRRARRTRKAKRSRMQKLGSALSNLGLDQSTIKHFISFCQRRGYKSLFDEETEDRNETPESEMTFRITREEFFSVLEKEINNLPEDRRKSVLRACEKILNRGGYPSNEIRPLRIDNRGVSRCAWEGCNAVTPRRDNDLKSPIKQFIFTVYAEKLRESEQLRTDIELVLDRLLEIGKRYRNASGPTPDKERRVLSKRLKKEMEFLRDVGSPETWKTNVKNITDLLFRTKGRNRFCKDHSEEYINCLLIGKVIPFKRFLTESDLTSRLEEILFQKLWRYLEAVVIPHAPEGIDRIVVERAAFDLLGGTFKQRRELSDEQLEKLYQEGPRLNFKDDLEMLKKEFNGLCVYCGKKGEELIQRDHMLPRTRFFFDSYLNLVPACPSCNQIVKNKATLGEASLIIHPDAYQAYSRYIQSKKPPHLLHTIKKGILNLMTDPERTWEAEKYLSIIANNFAEATQTQRSPRPLARYLSGKLYHHYRKAPGEIVFSSGRFTALWRRAAYPDFDKLKEKTENGYVNHALDAILLGCDLPSPTVLESRFPMRMELDLWSKSVKEKAPPEGASGIPSAPKNGFVVPGFTDINKDNYLYSDLSQMNWNRKDSKVQRQGAYGRHKREGAPVKRIAASALADGLRKADKLKSPEDRHAEVKKWLDIIAHPHLKKHLEQSNCGDSPGENTAISLTEWLRKAIKGNMAKTVFAKHPVDQMRQKMLLGFMEGKDLAIPGVIGIRAFYREHDSQIDLKRIDPNTKEVIHHYYADPANRAIIVAYRKNNGRIMRDRPLTLGLRQSGRVEPNIISLGPIPEGPLKGRSLGEPKPDSLQWNKALKEYLIKTHIAEYVFIHQGCVLCYEDGREKYIRNFASGYGFKKSLLKGIVGIRRSPLSRRMIPNEKLI